jgi:peptidoglycan/LPS O-acetylase OafA/YrhL
MLNRILGIIGGYAAMLVLTMTFFVIMTAAAPTAFTDPNAFPEMKYVIVILIAALVFALIGGWVMTMIVKTDLLPAAIGLSILIVAMGIVSVVTSPALQPLWYHAALIGLSIAGVMAVTFLCRRKRSR